mgnify:CR=1 FL=1
MMTKSGVLILNKTEKKNLYTLIHHVERDIDYGSEGTFGDGKKFNTKEATKVMSAVNALKWILEL